MTRYRFSLLGLSLGLIGSLLLAYSFGASPSGFTMVTTSDGSQELCSNGLMIFKTFPNGSGMFGPKCEEAEKGRPVAIIYADRPAWAKLGIWLVVIGFFIQVFTTEKPKGSTAVPLHPSYGPRQKSEKKKTTQN